jgi:hypothetical protein
VKRRRSPTPPNNIASRRSGPTIRSSAPRQHSRPEGGGAEEDRAAGQGQHREVRGRAQPPRHGLRTGGPGGRDDDHAAQRGNREPGKGEGEARLPGQPEAVGLGGVEPRQPQQEGGVGRHVGEVARHPGQEEEVRQRGGHHEEHAPDESRRRAPADQSPRVRVQAPPPSMSERRSCGYANTGTPPVPAHPRGPTQEERPGTPTGPPYATARRTRARQGPLPRTSGWHGRGSVPIEGVTHRLTDGHRSSLRPSSLEGFLARPATHGAYGAFVEGTIGPVVVADGRTHLFRRLLLCRPEEVRRPLRT